MRRCWPSRSPLLCYAKRVIDHSDVHFSPPLHGNDNILHSGLPVRTNKTMQLEAPAMHFLTAGTQHQCNVYPSSFPTFLRTRNLKLGLLAIKFINNPHSALWQRMAQWLFIYGMHRNHPGSLPIPAESLILTLWYESRHMHYSQVSWSNRMAVFWKLLRNTDAAEDL